MHCCVNHTELRAAARCRKCDHTFCERCAAFLVNGDVWCEPCGHALVEQNRGNMPLAGAVLLGGCVLVTGLIYLQAYALQRIFVWSFVLYGAPLRAAWHVAFPLSVGDPPVIIDRRETPAPLPPFSYMGGTYRG